MCMVNTEIDIVLNHVQKGIEIQSSLQMDGYLYYKNTKWIMISKASSTVAYGMGIITSHLYPLSLPDLMNEGGAIKRVSGFCIIFMIFISTLGKKNHKQWIQ